VLKTAQNVEVSNKKLIINTCEQYKDEMTLDVSAYLKLLDAGDDIGGIVSSIHETVLEQKQKAQEAERQKMQVEFEAKQEELQKKIDEPAEPVFHTEPIKLRQDLQEAPQITRTLELTASEEQLDRLEPILKSIGIKFKVLGATTTEEARPVWA